MRSEEFIKDEIARYKRHLKRDSVNADYITGKIDALQWVLDGNTATKPSETMNIFIKSLEDLKQRVEAIENKDLNSYLYTISYIKSGTGAKCEITGIVDALDYHNAVSGIDKQFEGYREVRILSLEKLK